MLMTLMESKKFKQKAGKSKSKLPSRSLNRQLTSESSDDNGTTWPRSRIPRSSNAPQPSTTDGLHIDETRCQHLAPPCTRAPYHPHAATPEASDMDETPRPRPRPRPRIVQSQALHNSMENRDDWDEEACPAIINTHGAKALTYRRESPQYDRHHPHAVQRDEQRLRNTHLPSQHNQDYHEESHHDNRYTSLQAPLQVQHRRHATDVSVNVCSHPWPHTQMPAIRSTTPVMDMSKNKVITCPKIRWKTHEFHIINHTSHVPRPDMPVPVKDIIANLFRIVWLNLSPALSMRLITLSSLDNMNVLWSHRQRNARSMTSTIALLAKRFQCHVEPVIIK